MSDIQQKDGQHSLFNTPKINFDEWAELAQRDPEAFEAKRKAVVEATIAMADSDIQERLRRTQWKVDRIRENEKNPMAACIKISELMWDSVTGPGGLKPLLDNLIGIEGKPELVKADVIEFQVDPFQKE